MTKIVVALGFMVAFAAGMAVGVQWQQREHASSARPTTRGARGGPGPGWLVAELNLTAQQQEQLRAIWSDAARRGPREQDERRRELRRQRDEAIAALVPPVDKSRYDRILKDYNDGMNAIEREMRNGFQTSVEKTKQILTPEQRQKYEQILSRHQWDRGRRGDDRATSRPATLP